MKVCIIASLFPPYTRGGAETAAYNIASMLSKYGHEVCVISCAPFSGRASFAGKWEKEDSMRVFRFTPFNLFTIFNIGKYPALLRLFWHVLDMFNLHSFLVVKRILKEENPDLILTHNLKGLGYTIPLAIKRYMLHATPHVKWFHTLHDLALLHPTGLKIFGRENNVLQKNPFVSLYVWTNKKLFGNPPIVISPSQFLLDEYSARGFFYKSKKVVIRNPASRFDITPSYMAKQIFSFLYVGQLEPYKGVQLLLDAWRDFSAKQKDVQLIVAGKGTLQEEVERAVKRVQHVQYVGFINPQELDELFVNAQVIVLPSLAYENSPTSIGESFSCGIPVIASRIGGIPELVQEGVNGILFEPGNSQALVQAMEKMRKEWEVLHMGAQKSAESFSSVRYADKLEDLLKNL